MIGKMSLCHVCANTRDWNEDGRLTCLAFPDGIPNELLAEGADHRVEFEGDGGVRFVPEDDSEETRRHIESFDAQSDPVSLNFRGDV